MNEHARQHEEAVERAVSDREHEGKPARVVTLRRRYATDVDDLWDALTNGERIPRWFLPIGGDLKLGGRYQFQGNAGGTITQCEPPHLLGATWEFGGQTSWVEVTLRALGTDAAELKLDHIAGTSPEAEQFWAQYGPGAVGVGWELGLLGLAQHIGTGEAVSSEAAFAWQASDEGKAFIRRSSEGWGAAAAASGADAQAAREAADRTSAFYTGEAAPEG
jgi:uncharacterized protein YndB with AHSA1/START domain